MKQHFKVAGNRSEGTPGLSEGMFRITYLDDEAGGEHSSLLVVMADSVEGHSGGRIATNLAVSTFNRYFVPRFGVSPTSQLLRAGVDDANMVLGRAIDEVPKLEGMACTLIGAAFTANRLYWASVGDAHLYLIRGGELRKLNADHTYGGYLSRVRAQGVEVEPEPGLTPDMLMSAATGEAIGEIDCPEEGLALQQGDRVVLASRRLAALGETTLLQASRGARDVAQGVAALLRAAAGPGGDGGGGTTVIVVDVPAPPPESASAPSAKPAVAAAVGAGSGAAADRKSVV